MCIDISIVRDGETHTQAHGNHGSVWAYSSWKERKPSDQTIFATVSLKNKENKIKFMAIRCTHQSLLKKVSTLHQILIILHD